MATATNTIRQRVRTGVRDAIRALALTGFAPESIVTRMTPAASGLGTPAIVISPGRVQRRPSPAGCRIREIAVVVSLYYLADGSGQPDADDQDDALETIEAAFDLPPQMPAALTAKVPEAQELRVRAADQYLPSAWRYAVQAHRTAIAVEVCQLAGEAA